MGSYPSFRIIGNMMGIVRRRIETESRTMPKKNMIKMNERIMIIGGTGSAAVHSLRVEANPDKVSIRLYIWAVISSKNMLAVV